MKFRNAAEAQKVWKPMDGTAPVVPGTVGGLPALRFPCNFHGAKIDRASWDRDIRMDLRLARGVRFWFRCRNADPVAYFSIYFRSGKGWYSATFSPRADGSWERIDITKAVTGVEDSPAGWGHIDAVRISAWRGGDTDTAFEIAGLGLLPADRDYLVIRGISSGARDISRYAGNVLRGLESLGLYPVQVDDVEVDNTLLRSVKLVILPYNPKVLVEVVIFG